MTVSTIGVADAGTPDKYLHTNQRTISSTAREDQYVLPGMGAYPTYSVTRTSISGATTAAHLIQIMGDGTNYSRLLRVHLIPLQSTSASGVRVQIVRLSSAGTGGTAITPAPYDTADTYAGGAMTLPSSKGTEGAALYTWFGYSPTANGVVYPLRWEAQPQAKPIVFGTATTSGIAVKIVTGVAGLLFDVTAEFLVTSYL